MPDDVALLVAGSEYSGWTSVSITRSIETASASYDLELTDRWGGPASAWPIGPSDECRVRIGSDTLVRGYIDRISGSLAGNQHALRVRGRDRTADLIDSSAEIEPGEWSGLDLLQIARKIAAPYGIDVLAEAPVGDAFGVFKLQPGETGWDAIERGARQRGLLVVSDREGRLILTRPGEQRASDQLTEGGNVLQARSRATHDERYARYVVLGSRPGSDNVQREQASAIRGEARDAGLGDRNRTLTIIAEQAVSPAAAQERAQWEATTRAARAAGLRITVQGWRQADGRLWLPNLVTPVTVPTLRAEGDMLITSVVYHLDNRGARADLSLSRVDAFQPKPVVAENDGGDLYGALPGTGELDTNWGGGVGG